MLDREAFAEAVARVVGKERERPTVGLLAEKTVHAVLKDYYEPDRAYHEQKVGAYHADILRDGCVIEIQSRNFDAIKDKLAELLKEHHVTLVHPIPATKYLVWVEPESGELSPRRRVPRRGRFTDAGRELFRISELIGHPNLAIHLLLVDMVEYRLRDGYGKDGKRGSHRHDRLPLSLSDALVLTTDASLASLLPPDLPTPFTAAEFRRAIAGGPRVSHALLTLLCRKGIVARVGKRANAYLYESVIK